MITCFYTNYIFGNDIKLIFLYLIANCDIMFFANYIFENDIKFFAMTCFHLIAYLEMT